MKLTRPACLATLCLSLLCTFSTWTAPALGETASTATKAPATLERRLQEVRFTSRAYRTFLGDTAVLTCLFLADQDPACQASPPVGTVGKIYDTTGRNRFTIMGKTAKARQFILDIENVTWNDVGFYQCQVNCGEKAWRAKTRLHVDVFYHQPTTSWWRADNGSLSVSCAGTGFPRGKFEWLNDTGLTTETATKIDRLWHINSTMFVPHPDPDLTAYFCILSVRGSREFDLGVVNIEDMTLTPEPEAAAVRAARAEQPPSHDEDSSDEEEYSTPLIIIIILACLLVALVLRCLCALCPCPCCCRIPAV